MSRFGPDPLEFFNSVYKVGAPWDIGAPQPAMAALIKKHPPANPILDLGCGSGDLSIHLAQLGYRVLGIDFVPSAIDAARKKAESLASETAGRVSFQVADALQPSLLQQTFGAVMDSGFYHLFSLEQCDRLVDEVGSILNPNGCFYLHEFAIDLQVPNMPRQISIDELQKRFTVDRGWRVKEIQSVEFFSRVAPPLPAVCACIERLAN